MENVDAHRSESVVVSCSMLYNTRYKDISIKIEFAILIFFSFLQVEAVRVHMSHKKKMSNFPNQSCQPEKNSSRQPS